VADAPSADLVRMLTSPKWRQNSQSWEQLPATGFGPMGDKRSGETRGTQVNRQVAVVLYVVAMAAVIVGLDLMFFRNRFWERLIVNIGIVLVFAAFYLRFYGRP
jgi:hypothetical protein